MASGDLIIDLVARTQRWNRGLYTAERRFDGFLRRTMDGFARLGLAINGVKSAISLLRPLAMPIQLAAEAEQIGIAFEVMTGSASASAKMIADLRKQAAGTPFQFTDLSRATKVLMRFGISSGDALKDVNRLSEVAAGDAQALQSLSLAFAQVAASGHLRGQEVLQFVNAGLNPLMIISQKTGESMEELRKKMEKGQISFQQVRDAFITATSAGGAFYQMNDRQSKTLLGRWSTLKDEVTRGLIDIGTAIISEFDLKDVTANLTEFVKDFKTEWIPELVGALKDLADSARDFSKDVSEAFSFLKDLQVASGIDSGGGLFDMPKHERSGRFFGGEFSNIDLAARAATIDRGRAMLDAQQGPFTPRQMTPEAAAREEELTKFWDNWMKQRQQRLDNRPGAMDIFGHMANQAFGAASGFVGDQLQRASVDQFVGPTIDPAVLNHRGDPQATNDGRMIGSLEANSSHAAEVLRAMVGPKGGKVQEQQLKEAKKQTKKLEEIAKKMKEQNLDIWIGEID